MRITKVAFGLEIAATFSKLSRCVARQVGCAIVSKDRRYIVGGYNGPPRGIKLDDMEMCDVACPRRLNNDQDDARSTCFVIHAEVNALIQADHSRIVGGTAYVTTRPCLQCAAALANSGVASVICNLDDTSTIEASGVQTLFRQANIYYAEYI